MKEPTEDTGRKQTIKKKSRDRSSMDATGALQTSVTHVFKSSDGSGSSSSEDCGDEAPRCLTSRHARSTCEQPVCDIEGCGLEHHRLLHYMTKREGGERRPQSTPAVAIETASDVDRQLTKGTVAHVFGAANDTVTLKIIKIKIYGPAGARETHALLDDGASCSLIDEDLANEIGLTGEKRRLLLTGAWEGQELRVESEDAYIDISGTTATKPIDILKIRVKRIPKLKLPTQSVSIDIDKYPYLSDIKYLFAEGDIRPKVLLGHDNYDVIKPIQILCGETTEPYATLTALGWTVHGYGCNTMETENSEIGIIRGINLHVSCSTDDLRDLHDMVKNSFTLDALGISSHERVNSGDTRAIETLNRTAKRIQDRWEVGLPWKSDNPVLPDTYFQAVHRLKVTEAKFIKDQEYAEQYKKQMEHIFSSGYAREVTPEDDNSLPTWYLPHFGVRHPSKPGKLRLVYDAAAKVQGHSLNDFLLTGPDYLVPILGVLMRFREKPVAIIGDIKEMFLQIKIRTEDRNAQRFLWRDNTSKAIKKCVMTSLIFGTTCSPFVAQYVKNRNAEEFRNEFPEAVNSIIRDCYMDDFLHSSENEETAKRLIEEVSNIYSRGGFQMVGWASNRASVLQSTPTEKLTSAAILFKDGENSAEKTLGLKWYTTEDAFAFDVSLKKIPTEILSGEKRPSKRIMLRIIMSVYDVHGFLSPFTVKAKILLQATERYAVDPLRDFKSNGTTNHRPTKQSGEFNSHTTTTQYAMSTLQNLKFEEDRIIELHTFCDASEKAYAAVAYWRFVQSDGRIHISFIAGKSRVAPVRPTSVPRLELQGALLASRLAATIQREHEMKAHRRIFWTDSTTVLMWIRSDPKQYKTFVSHRLGEIDELTQISEWRYVPTKVNVADIATRGMWENINVEDVWFQGPAYLWKEESSWPEDWQNPHATEEAIKEEKQTVCTVVDEGCSSLPIPDNTRFSSWNRLLRATGTILVFIKRCRKMDCRLNLEILHEAEKLLIKEIQIQSFSEEIKSLNLKRQIHCKSRLSTLTPILDEDGILRLGGRIDAAPAVERDVKRRHHITRLLVKHYHERAAHGSNEMVVNELRQKYWILNLRPTVRTVASRCIRCRILRATPTPPRMGDLPADRLDHHQRPFTRSGVDLFGPMEVSIGRRREKRYGVLFTCFATRAIHVELAHSLSTDSLIMALRRMSARRGYPRTLYSDNGTNLRGADVELKKALLEKIEQKTLMEEAERRGVEWHFIPPASPHMGGAWERLIRSVKTALHVVLRERAPREEILLTLLAEVEDMVNSRPITFVSVDARDPEALTPNHFLIGRSSSSPAPGRFDEKDLCLSRQWRVSKGLAEMFWRRWQHEYLPLLLRRPKWTREERSLQVGDLVLVSDPNQPRNEWLKGVVETIYPGTDGRVRVADVTTHKGRLRRPATRLADLGVLAY